MEEFTWIAESEQKKRGTDWFWAVGLISIVGALVAFYFGNTIFGIFILISGGLLFYFNTKNIPPVPISITEKEITIGGIKYLTKKMRGFSIVKNSRDNETLLIRTDRFFMPLLTIAIPDNMDLSVLEETLEKRIKKEDLSESPIGALADKLGF
jgi:hypothetical protein